MDATSEALKLIFDPELFLFQSDDPDFVPIRACHLRFDHLLKFFVFVGQFLDMSL